jgi:hypothetical protein
LPGFFYIHSIFKRLHPVLLETSQRNFLFLINSASFHIMYYSTYSEIFSWCVSGIRLHFVSFLICFVAMSEQCRSE